MLKVVAMVILLTSLNGCSMLGGRPPSIAIPMGATAFSGGYSDDGAESSNASSGRSHWTEVILGLGVLTAIFGGCFAMKTEQGKDICFSVLDGLLAH